MCHKKQAITWATKCGTVSHHSLSIPESAFLWGRRFSHFTLTWVDWVSHSQNDGQFFFKWCDGNVFWQGTILRVFRWFLVQATSGFDCCPEPGKQCDGHMVASLGATIGFVGFPMVFRSEATIGFDCLFWLSTVGQTMRCSSLPQTYFV